jgi:hypothetical protein
MRRNGDMCEWRKEKTNKILNEMRKQKDRKEETKGELRKGN